MRETSLGDESIGLLTKFVKLKSLDLRESSIDSANLAKLRAALPNCQIQAFTAEQRKEQFDRETAVFNWSALEVTKLTATDGPALRLFDDPARRDIPLPRWFPAERTAVFFVTAVICLFVAIAGSPGLHPGRAPATRRAAPVL